LYIQDESSLAQENGLAAFDPTEEIHWRKSWDTEATTEEKAATDALMTRIHELQNTDGEELSGVQIISYFLRIRVQPLQAHKNLLWMYSRAKDVERISNDLSERLGEARPPFYHLEQKPRSPIVLSRGAI
jgi:hypothetical protein